MRRSDLEGVAQLFELAGGGGGSEEDSEAWDNKFQEHVHRVMNGHSVALQSISTQLEKGLESFRARAELLRIVQERVVARTVHLDPGLAQAVHRLYAAMEVIFDGALQLQLGRDQYQGEGDLDASSPGAGRPRSRSESPSQMFSSTPGAGFRADPESSPRFSRMSTATSAVIAAQQTPRGDRFACIMDDEPGPASPMSLQSTVTTTVKPNTGTGSPSRGNKGYAQIHDARHQRERYERWTGRPGKEMNLQQLKEHIENLYSSKEEANERHRATGLPYQTLEQHFYSCLVRRFEKLPLVEEFARAFFTAIEKFAAGNVEIQAFGKIMQNRLSESQSVVLRTLKETAKTLLHKQLEEQNPAASPSDHDELWADWQKNGLPLAVCERVATHMYEYRDAEELMEQVRPLAGSPGPSLPEIARVCGREFRETLLAFQVNLAEFYISDLHYMYFEIDRDALQPCKGMLTACQAMELAKRMAVIEEPEEMAEPGSRTALHHAFEEVLPRLADKKTISLSECIDDIFSDLIGLRWRARGGIHRHRSDRQEE